MNRTAVFWILPLTAICRGAYGWQLGRFLAGSTGGTRRQAGIFSILYFICIFVWDLAAEFWMLPYILSVSLWHLFFGALVIFLFKGGWERKVSMAVVLTAIDTLVGNFSSSLFSAFALAAKNTLKIGGTSYLSMESGYILGCLSVMATALALWLLSGRLALVFSDKVN